MDAQAEDFPAFLYRQRDLVDDWLAEEQAKPSLWSRAMQNLAALRREVHGLFSRGYTMTKNGLGTSNASVSAQAQVQTNVDPVLLEALRAIDKMRALDGERSVNHMLRNLLQQSNKRLSDLGMPASDENADLRMQVLKHESEARRAKQYANHFGSKLREIGDLGEKAELLDAQAIVDGALKWDPDFHQSAADLGEELARATH